MNPIEINIKVGLEDNTLKILTALMTAAVRAEGPAPAQDPVEKAREAVQNAEQAVAAAEQTIQEKPKPAKGKGKAAQAVAEKPAETQAPAAEVKEEPIEDMPEDICETKEITDTDLRAVVTETRQRIGSAAPIRSMMADKFGLKVSTDCPQEKRQEFINALKEL